MLCKLLTNAFANAENNPRIFLDVNLGVHVVGALREKAPDIATVAGSGMLQYKPQPKPVGGVEFASFSGLIACSIVWQDPEGKPQGAEEEVTAQIKAPLGGVFSIRWTTKAGPFPLNGDFTPLTCNQLGPNRVYLAGYYRDFVSFMLVTVTEVE
jgi:hypothetical protein